MCQSEGDPLDPQCPNPAEVEKLIRYRLAVVKTRDGQTLEFALEWSQESIDQWIREQVPVLFEFLDLRYLEDSGPNSFHWVLLSKSQRKLFAMNRPHITGEEVDQAKGPANWKPKEHTVRIGESQFSLCRRDRQISDVATKRKIPSAIYKNLTDAIKRLEAGEELASESEAESNAPPSKGKSWARAKKRVPVKTLSEVDEELSEDSDSTGQNGDSVICVDSDDDDSDRCAIVKREPKDDSGTSFPHHLTARTDRSSESLFLSGKDSDIEEYFPESISEPLPVSYST